MAQHHAKLNLLPAGDGPSAQGSAISSEGVAPMLFPQVAPGFLFADFQVPSGAASGCLFLIRGEASSLFSVCGGTGAIGGGAYSFAGFLW